MKKDNTRSGTVDSTSRLRPRAAASYPATAVASAACPVAAFRARALREPPLPRLVEF